MQADEFEKKIRDKMEDFALVPGREVWPLISGKISREKKKRRLLLFWLFTGFILLTGASLLWFIKNEDNQKLVTDINKKQHNEEDYKIKQNINPSKNFNKIYKVKRLKSIAFAPDNQSNNVQRYETKNNTFSKIKQIKDTIEKPTFYQKKDNTHNEALAVENKQNEKPLPLHRYYNPNLQIIAKTESALKNINTKGGSEKDISAKASAKKENASKKGNKKLNLGFTVFSGLSDNLAGLPILNKSSARSDYASSPLNSGTNIGNSYNENLSISFKSSFSFGLGIFATKNFTKKISLSAGVNYHVYKAISTVGSKVNLPGIYDSALRALVALDGYYVPGSSVQYSNKYQLLELPVNIAFQLNKNQSKPVLFSAGISPGYILASNALYTNSTTNVYYTDRQKFRHFQLSAQTGFLFPITGFNKNLLSAGPAIQYALTNAAKTAGAKQHLFFAGIKANIILK